MGVSWNFRVIHFDGEENCFGICEVFYDDEKITGWSDAVEVVGDDVEELRWTLDKMREALSRPVLKESQLNE